MAEWKPFDLTWGRSIYYCTECKEGIEVPTSCGKPMYKFCPMCGARMDTADTPQTETKGAGYCNECKWFRDKQVCGRCRSRNLFAKADTPQKEDEIVLDPSFAELSDEQFVKAMKLIEPQTDYEIAKAIVHKAIDNTAIAEDVYPDLRQRLHDAVENTPQTESTGSPIGDYRDGVGAWQTDRMTEEEFDTMIAKGLLWQTDCDDRYAIRTDSGEVVAHACPLGCERTDSGWK